MARNSSGVYSLPAAFNPVVTLTKITTAWANNTLADVAGELTNSLDRNGRGAMLAPLQLADGTAGLPGLTFGAETGSGLSRTAPGVLRLSILGNTRVRLSNTLLEVPMSNFDGTVTNLLPVASRYRFAFTLPTGSSVAENTDGARLLIGPAGGGTTVFFPNTSTLEVGSEVVLYNPAGAATPIVISPSSSTLIWLPSGATGSRNLAANGLASVLKVAATTWVISGTGIS